MLHLAFAAYLFFYATMAGALTGEAWGRGAHLSLEQWAHHGLLNGLGYDDHHGHAAVGVGDGASGPERGADELALASVAFPLSVQAMVVAQSQSGSAPLLAIPWLNLAGASWSTGDARSELLQARLAVPMGLLAAPPEYPPPHAH